MHAGFAFDIELRRGAGAYICGEETALFNSIEGKRGEPRNKPPFPVTHGVFGRPTSINNVETLVNVLQVLELGADAYAALGTEGSTGTRLFCLSGHVEQPGVYEAEHGITLGEAIAMAGGVRDGAPIKAVLLGGAAGGFLGPDRLDARLTFEDARAGGYTLGSGVIMVLDDTVDLVDLCLRIARFFRDESCGQCVPCRVGTVRQEEALHRLVAGRTIGTTADELALLAGRRRGDDRCVDLRSRADRRQRRAVGDRHVRPVRSGGGRMSAVPLGMPRDPDRRRDRRTHGARAGGLDDPGRVPRRRASTRRRCATRTI